MICLHSFSDTERDLLVFGTQSILKLGRPLSSLQGILSYDMSCLSQKDVEILESLEDLGVEPLVPIYSWVYVTLAKISQ